MGVEAQGVFGGPPDASRPALAAGRPGVTPTLGARAPTLGGRSPSVGTGYPAPVTIPGPSPFPGTPAPAETVPRARRLLRWELLIVLAVFPLPAVIAAITSAANHLLHQGPGAAHASVLVPGSVPVSVVLGVALELSSIAAAGLVWYLLVRSGEGTGAIGLDKTRPKVDAALVLPVFGVVFFASFFVGGIVEAALGLKTFPVDDPVHGLAYLPVLLAGGLAAGIVEETVVLGYLVRRLEQLGVRPVWVVVIAVAVRGSYHLYYGPGVIPILVWATASVLVYRKVRRLAPFMVVHSLWDMSLFLAQAFSPWVVVAEFLILLVPTIVVTALWWPRRPRMPWTPPPVVAWSPPGAPAAVPAPGPAAWTRPGPADWTRPGPADWARPGPAAPWRPPASAAPSRPPGP